MSGVKFNDTTFKKNPHNTSMTFNLQSLLTILSRLSLKYAEKVSIFSTFLTRSITKRGVYLIYIKLIVNSKVSYTKFLAVYFFLDCDILALTVRDMSPLFIWKPAPSGFSLTPSHH